jgi:hypothetical protein
MSTAQTLRGSYPLFSSAEEAEMIRASFNGDGAAVLRGGSVVPVYMGGQSGSGIFSSLMGGARLGRKYLGNITRAIGGQIANTMKDDAVRGVESLAGRLGSRLGVSDDITKAISGEAGKLVGQAANAAVARVARPF